jgi:hypothetical protein
VSTKKKLGVKKSGDYRVNENLSETLSEVFEDNLPDERYRWSINEIIGVAKMYGAINNHLVYNTDPCSIDFTFRDGSSFKLNIWFKKSAVVLSPNYEKDRGKWLTDADEFEEKFQGRVFDAEMLNDMAHTYNANASWFNASGKVFCRIIFPDGSSATLSVEADEFTVTRTSKALNAVEHPAKSTRRHRPHRTEPIMNTSNALRETLAKLIASDGAALMNDRVRCLGLLCDYHPRQRHEIKLLMDALAEGIPERLARSRPELSVVVPRLIRDLEAQLFLTQEAATWTVETWTLALYPTWSGEGEFSKAKFTPERANQHIRGRHRTQPTNQDPPIVEPVKAEEQANARARCDRCNSQLTRPFCQSCGHKNNPFAPERDPTPPKPQHILGRHRTQPTNPHRSFPIVKSTKAPGQSIPGGHYTDDQPHRSNQCESVTGGHYRDDQPHLTQLPRF